MAASNLNLVLGIDVDEKHTQKSLQEARKNLDKAIKKGFKGLGEGIDLDLLGLRIDLRLWRIVVKDLSQCGFDLVDDCSRTGKKELTGTSKH